MNERYREAAECLERQACMNEVYMWADKKDPALLRQTKSLRLASSILSKLATGEWVLCDARRISHYIQDPVDLPEKWTPLYAPIPELP